MKRQALIILLLITMFLTGCWDRTDIESRGYVLGLAIDKYPSKGGSVVDKEKEEVERMELHAGKPAYALTVQVPILTKDAEEKSGSEGKNKESQTWQITQIGNSFMSMNREMQSRISFPLYYEHLQVIVISEEVAREGIEKVLDFFVRDHELRRRVKVFISECDAKKVLEVEPKIQDYSSIYLALLPTNSARNSRVLQQMDLGEVINSIHGGYNFILPRVTPVGSEMKASGGAAFSGDRMIGWLGELEIEAWKFITGFYKGGVVTVEVPGEEGLYTVEITKASSKTKADVDNNIPSFTVDIKIKGNYASEELTHTHGSLKKELITKIEDQAGKEIERVCNLLIKKVQEDYKADIFRLNLYLKANEPEYWKKNRKNWDSIFPNVEIKVNAKVDVELIGIVR